MPETMVISTEKEDSANKVVNGSRKYSVYNYMKEHTTVLVACVSAFVAVISFVLNYAASRYTGAYLQYWVVDMAYAKENNTELVYAVLFSLLYTFVIVVTNKIMGSTADAFGFYNRIMSALKWYYKDIRAEKQKIKQKMKLLEREYTRTTNNKKTKASLPNKSVEKMQAEQQALNVSMQDLSSLRRKCQLYLGLNVLGSALIIFGLLIVSVDLAASNDGTGQTLGLMLIASIVVIFDLFLYILPAYYSSRIKKREYKDITLQHLEEEIKHADKHRFPFAAIAHTAVKDLLSNRRLLQIAILSVLLVLMNIAMYSTTGRIDAEKAREFPVCTDETGTYAVVYNNGESLVLKSAEISGNQIEIDVRNQKVISATDVSYQIRTFETVIVTGKDGG